jgi:hypothetical protein
MSKRKLVDFPPETLAAVLDTLREVLAPPVATPESLATQEGLLKHAHELGRYSVIDTVLAAYNGATRSNTALNPTTSPFAG